ncbi:MAG: fluoride efflux transporter CrcB [Sphingomonadaceae bacterium]|nr:fluoride efflux transporter CrcB [Sphingomonadaceae bacterium]
MPPILLVMLGGALGAGARYTVGRCTAAILGTAWPYGTLGVNILGGLAMGLLAGWLGMRASGGGEAWRLALGVGVLGGFTTFSAFSLEVFLMLERGETGSAIGYVAVSVTGSCLALAAGLRLMRALV